MAEALSPPKRALRSGVASEENRKRLNRLRCCSSNSEFGTFPEPGPEIRDNSMIQQEAEEINKEFRQLSQLQPKFPSFDTEGKCHMISKMDKLLERLNLFTTRFRWSDDPFAKEATRRLDAQLAEAGMSFDGLKQMLEQSLHTMRQQVDMEERLGPAAVAQANQSYGDSKGPPDIASLMDDPQFMRAMEDASALAAYQEAMKNGPQEALKQYHGNENAKYIVKRIFSLT